MKAIRRVRICRIIFSSAASLFAANFIYFLILMQIGYSHADMAAGHVISLTDHEREVYITNFQYLVWIGSLCLAALLFVVAIIIIKFWNVQDK